MESPNLFGFILFFYFWDSSKVINNIENWILLGIYTFHYINRAILYPLKLKPSRPFPLFIMFMALTFCSCNVYIQSYYAANTEYPNEYYRV